MIVVVLGGAVRIQTRGSYSPTWFALRVIAGLIGAVAILTNSEILIVGAMVVGPEYGVAVVGLPAQRALWRHRKAMT
jgi:hypothetical protein